MVKTIGIDCRFAGTASGLGRYTRELVTHLLKRKDDVKYVLFVSGKDHSWIPKGTDNYQLTTTNFSHYSLSEQLFFPWKLFGLDLFFSPHFNVPFLCPVPFVATIHDLILHRYPNAASGFKQKAYRFLMGNTVRRANALIAVSKFTAQEIGSVYGKDAKSKISVIHQAVGEGFRRKSAAQCAGIHKKYGLQKPFFIYVGNAKEHKNVQMLINAYASLGTTETELVLVIGGPEADKLTLVDGVRILRDVPDDDLPCLYFYALCFVTASLYEGFGLPVLEAAASGCPVIVTDRGALPEIAPAASLIVEPTVEAIAEALREHPLPSDMGKMRGWEDVAEATFEVFQKCLMVNR